MATKKSDADFAQDAIDDIVKKVTGEASPREDGFSFSINPSLFESLYKRYAEMVAATGGLALPLKAPHNIPMTDVTRPELDAKLEAIEARMDGRVAAISGKIDVMLAKMDERDRSYDQRFAGVEENLKETKAAVSSLKSTTIITAISAVLAIVFGVAAFNATVLSNMVASFESGKNTSAAQAQVQQQIRETQQLLEDVRRSAKPSQSK